MNVDAPVVPGQPGAAAPVVQPFTVSGWAIDLAAASGTGVSTVHLWAFPASGAPPIFVGWQSEPNFISRPDVGVAFGNDQFNQSGFNVQVSGLPPGVYSLVTSAWSTVSNGFTQAFSRAVIVDSQVAAPVLSPPPGTYTTPQAIFLTSPTQNAQIHYTTDGSEPTPAAPSFQTPIALPYGSSLTVRTRAFKNGMIASQIVTGAYNVTPQDTSPPQIIAIVTPAPTATGWNGSDVTVSFHCSDSGSGVSSCPQPATLTYETASQVITGTALDVAGNSASTSVTVRIDKTAGVVSIVPAPGAITTAASVAFAGTVTDALAGIVAASCNGVPVTPIGTTVSCVVPLEPGVNSITLQAQDGAGNSASKGFTITRIGAVTSVVIEPRVRTIEVGQITELRLLDNFGQAVGGATWTTSNQGVAAISPSPASAGVGIAPGSVTITGTSQGMSATLDLTVAPVGGLVGGTIAWQRDVTPGLHAGPPIFPRRTSNQTPDLFDVEVNADGAPVAVRALRSDGQQLWRERATGNPRFGDEFGGIIGVASGAVATNAIVRFGGGTLAPPWRYESRGVVGDIAQAGDGTIFALENVLREPGLTPVLDHMDSYIVVIDGTNGLTKARIPLPGSVIAGLSLCPQGGPFRTEYAAVPSTLAVSADSALHVTVPVSSRTHTRTPDCVSIANEVLNVKLALLKVSSSGTYSWLQDLFAHTQSGIALTIPIVSSEQAVPDQSGAVYIEWEARDYAGPGTIQRHLARVSGSGVSELPLPDGSLQLISDQGIGYVTTASTVRALNLNSGFTLWVASIAGTPAIALKNSGVAMHNATTGVLSILDGTGFTTETASMPLIEATSVLSNGRYHGILTATGQLAEMVGPLAYKSLFSFQKGKGNSQRQGRPQEQFFQLPYQAAVAVLQEYGPLSVELKREFGGSICKATTGAYVNRFFPTIPDISPSVPGQPPDSGTVVPSSCPAAIPHQLMGEYHTHPSGFFFSAQDAARMLSTPFLGKTFWLSNPCGDIWEYRSPDALPVPTTDITDRSVKRPERIRTSIVCVQ